MSGNSTSELAAGGGTLIDAPSGNCTVITVTFQVPES
jgi:hypothetical protein